jgi:hypothetical protein
MGMNRQKNRPPKNKRPAASDAERTEGKRSDERPAPAAAERTEVDPLSTAPIEPAAAVPRPPVTNQDEQDKITNAASDDIPNV